MEKDFSQLATEESLRVAVAALRANGLTVEVAKDGAEAKRRSLALLPEKAEVMTMTSVTLAALGLAAEINKSGKFASVRERLLGMDKETQGLEMKKFGAAPEWVLGSVHAITEDGRVVVASATGSQLPAYIYGASHVLWIAGTQKIVKDLKEALRRVDEYVLPLEDARARKAYGKASGVNKLFILNREVDAGRITLILVKEKLGF